MTRQVVLRGGVGLPVPVRASAGRIGAAPRPRLAGHLARPLLTKPAGRPSRAARTVAMASNSSDPDPLDRALAAAPYLIPLVDALGRGRFLFAQFPSVFGLLLAPIRPLAQLYYSVPFASLAIFFAVYLGIIQNQSIPRFARYR